ncbi:hypothetical protein [Mycoplasma sp. P36-A1]|uniref:hypothetical protein n=1 Tax=Mycoplasma sp. P36-A1 TaxID=3252900 RepID=UPI003C30DD04
MEKDKIKRYLLIVGIFQFAIIFYAIQINNEAESLFARSILIYSIVSLLIIIYVYFKYGKDRNKK